MNNRTIWFSKSSGFALIASTVLMLLTSGVAYEMTFVSSIDDAFAQQNATNMTSGRQMRGEGMQGMGGGEGMQGMGGGEGMQIHLGFLYDFPEYGPNDT